MNSAMDSWQKGLPIPEFEANLMASLDAMQSEVAILTFELAHQESRRCRRWCLFNLGTHY